MKTASRITVALATLAFATSSSPAAIIYSGQQNIIVSSSFTSVFVDVDALGTNASETPGWDIDAFFGGEAFGNSENFQPVRQTIANNSAIVRLYFGDIVDSTDTYASSFAGSSTHIGNAADQFASGVEGYLGFRLIDNGNAGPYYGWMRVNFSNTGGSGTIIDWAYESTGAAISVGAVPEPTAALLGGAGLLTFVFRRRR